MEKIECDKCDKVIEGYTDKQIKYLMKVHKLAKHGDRRIDKNDRK